MKLIAEFREYWKYHAPKMMFWLRMVCYFLIYIQPMFGIILEIYLDSWDFDYFKKYGLSKQWYDRMDTVVDYIEYIILIPIVYFTPIWIPYILFLLWRTIGMVIYYVFNTRKGVFVIFPNMAEYIALSYFICNFFNIAFDVTQPWYLLFLLGFKILHEMELHLVQYKLNPAPQDSSLIVRSWRNFNYWIIR